LQRTSVIAINPYERKEYKMSESKDARPSRVRDDAGAFSLDPSEYRQKPSSTDRESLFVERGQSRTGDVYDVFGNQIFVKLQGSDVAGSYAVMETLTQPQGGPPVHRHEREDESFYVIEGKYLFEVDGKSIQASSGCFLHAPKGSVHTFQNVGTTTGRMLMIVQPAGLDLFFAELASATERMHEPDLSLIVPVFHKYGMEILGPPISARLKTGTDGTFRTASKL
jgi:quercetin dioxygenase-like cupin family protein